MVEASSEVVVERLKSRDGMDQEAIDRIRRAQGDWNKRRGEVDDLIENNGDLETLRSQIRRLCPFLRG